MKIKRREEGYKFVVVRNNRHLVDMCVTGLYILLKFILSEIPKIKPFSIEWKKKLIYCKERKSSF